MHAREPTPEPGILLYDGWCRFCKRSAAWAVRLAKPGSVRLVSFRDEGVVEAIGGLTREGCEQAMHLIEPGGAGGARITRGAEACARLLATRWGLGLIAHVYYLPPVRWGADHAYAWIARNRFAFGGRCDGACGVHHTHP